MKQSRASLLIGAAVSLLLGFAGPAAAEGHDAGDYQILHARYGTAERNVDVTHRLKELARRDVSFRVSNETFGGDPHPNRVKALRIYARGRDGKTRTFEYVEGSTVDGDRFTGWSEGDWGHGGWNGGWGDVDVDAGGFQILQARYGTSRHNVDVTKRLKDLARHDREFRVSNETFGVDPHPDHVKVLRVYVKGRDGKNTVFEYAEGSVVDGDRFSGWSEGDWGHGDRKGPW